MAAKTYYPPFIPAFSSNGAPVPGARLNFYFTGTDTRAPTYSDSALSVELENPVVADASGKFPPIYLDDTVTYRVVQTDRNGALIGDAIDPYIPGTALKGQDALPPVTVEIETVDGVLTYPQTGDFSDINPDFKYDSNLFVRLNGVVLDKDEDYTAPGDYAPITLTDNPGDGKLVLTTYAAESRDGAGRVLVIRQIPEANDSAAVLRARDTIRAAGGGNLHFPGNPDGSLRKYFFSSDTQNESPLNSGNLTSNLLVTQDPGVELWPNRPDGPFHFFHNRTGNQGAVLMPPDLFDVEFRGLVFRDDPTETGLGYEENSAAVHISGGQRILFNQCKFIGMRGDGVYVGAGDLGPDGNGERQNRMNYDWTFRDCFWDGINKNNRNAVSFISGRRFKFEGVNISRNWGRPGGVGAYDLYDINTGVPAPAGGFDVEKNFFTANGDVGDISGTIYVEDSGAAGMALLDHDNKADGIDVTVFATRCRLGGIAFSGNEQVAERPRNVVRVIARECPKPFELLRGGGLWLDVQAYDCPNAADLGYLEGRRLSGVTIKGYFERCGASGLIMRAIGGGYDIDATFLNCPGTPLSQTVDTFETSPGVRVPTVVENVTLNLKLAPTSTVFPPNRVLVENDGPEINGATILDIGGTWYDDEGEIIADSTVWQARGKPSIYPPDRGSWPVGVDVPAMPTLEPGSPIAWRSVERNDFTLPATTTPLAKYPVFLVTQQVPGFVADAAGLDVSGWTASAFLRRVSNSRVAAMRANQTLFNPSAASSRTRTIRAPYSGSRTVYVGFSSKTTPNFYPEDADGTRLRDMDYGIWFDGDVGLARVITGDSTRGTPVAFKYGEEFTITITASGSVRTGSVTKAGSTTLDSGATLTNDATFRDFLILGTASETLQFVS